MEVEDRARVAHRAETVLDACARYDLDGRVELPSPRRWVDARPITAARERERRGVRFDTPWSLADQLAVAFTDGGVPPWWIDPCCGVGRLLVAALEAWVRRGISADELQRVRAGLRFGDVDEDAVAVANDAVLLWSARMAQNLWVAGRREAAAGLARVAQRAPRGASIDMFERQHPIGGWVITNPPFESIRALHRRIGKERVAELKQRFRECRGAFDAGVPVVARCARWASNGRLALVAPLRWRTVEYATGLRRTLAGMGPWTQLPAPTNTFAASVETMLVCSGRVGSGAALNWSESEQTPLGTVRVGELAEVRSGTPGFDARSVSESLADDAPARGWRFLSAGSIRSWSVAHGPLRLCGRQFVRPYLPREAIDSEARRALYDSPKIVIPGVARGVQAAWDEEGSALSVGVVAVVPHLREHQALLLAALNAPWATAWLDHVLPGRGLSGGYRRVGARQIERLPVPDPGRPDVQAVFPELQRLVNAARLSGEPAERARAEITVLMKRLYAVATRPVPH